MDEIKNVGMLIWSWSSAGSLCQAVATGVKDDPVDMYIKFYAKDTPPPPGGGGEENPKPEPEFSPNFDFPVEKVDANPGWDGDPPATHCTVEPIRTEWTANVKYKVVETRPDGRFIEPDSGIRDTSGTDNATTDMTVGTNGYIYIYDIPYGTYTIDEAAAGDTLSYWKALNSLSVRMTRSITGQ